MCYIGVMQRYLKCDTSINENTCVLRFSVMKKNILTPTPKNVCVLTFEASELVTLHAKGTLKML